MKKDKSSLSNKEYIKKIFAEDGIKAPASLSEDRVMDMLNSEDKKAEAKKKTIDFPSLIFLLGLSLILSALCTEWGTALRKASPKALQVFDVATFRIVLISVLGLILAMTPIGKIAGSTELSNIMLYMVIGLIASRASFMELLEGGMAWWIVAGFLILGIHGVLMALMGYVIGTFGGIGVGYLMSIFG